MILPFERKMKIEKAVQQQEIVYISELAEKLDVSEITIRRDLKNLEEEGKLVMLHGGAAKLIDTSKETDLGHREAIYNSEKDKIGQIAAKYINSKDIIFVDSGTTNIKMLKYIKNKDISIVTNGLKTIEEAAKYNLNVTSVGGDYKNETGAFVGALTLRTVNSFHFDLCFLGTNGVHLENGFTNADPNESLIKEMVIMRSKKSFILADNSKFDATSVYKFGDISDAQVITDKIPKKFKKLKNIISV